jgi:hypothetical protein
MRCRRYWATTRAKLFNRKDFERALNEIPERNLRGMIASNS